MKLRKNSIWWDVIAVSALIADVVIARLDKHLEVKGVAIAFAVLSGAIIGSYVITAWSRYKSGVEIARVDWKRFTMNAVQSHCFSCHSPLYWRDVLPILSYVRTRGHCPKCGVPTGTSTLLWEVGTAIVLGLVASVVVFL